MSVEEAVEQGNVGKKWFACHGACSCQFATQWVHRRVIMSKCCKTDAKNPPGTIKLSCD